MRILALADICCWLKVATCKISSKVVRLMKVAILNFDSLKPQNISWDDRFQSSELTRQSYKMPCWMKVAILRCGCEKYFVYLILYVLTPQNVNIKVCGTDRHSGILPNKGLIHIIIYFWFTFCG